MTTALIVNKNDNLNHDLENTIHQQYANWDMISVDKFEDALEKIQSGLIDVMALDSHLPCKECQKLAFALHDKKPDAEIYIAMENPAIKTDYSRVMNRGLILVPH